MMKRCRLALLPLALFPLAVVAAAPADEYQNLFNGRDLDGWVVEGPKEYQDGDTTKPVWVARDGMITCQVNNRKSFGFLRYEKREFADFALHVEYRMSPKPDPKTSACNSGIGIRTVPFDPKKSTATRPSYAAYEVQLLDDADAKPNEHGTGSLYRYVAPKVNVVKPAPEWNAIDIECVGPNIKITLNNQVILEVDQTTIDKIKDKPLKGYVCLQNHGGKIDFKNIRIREIKAK
jgi:hypothetical protein